MKKNTAFWLLVFAVALICVMLFVCSGNESENYYDDSTYYIDSDPGSDEYATVIRETETTTTLAPSTTTTTAYATSDESYRDGINAYYQSLINNNSDLYWKYWIPEINNYSSYSGRNLEYSEYKFAAFLVYGDIKGVSYKIISVTKPSQEQIKEHCTNKVYTREVYRNNPNFYSDAIVVKLETTYKSITLATQDGTLCTVDKERVAEDTFFFFKTPNTEGRWCMG